MNSMRLSFFSLLSLSVIAAISSKDLDWLSSTKCSIRYNFFSLINTIFDCNKVKELSPQCARNFTVFYSEHPPYVFTKNGRVQGMMVDLLNEILINTCCLGCNSLHFYPPMGFFDKFLKYDELEEISLQPDIVIPVENGANNKLFFGSPYVPLFHNKMVSFIAEDKDIELDVITILTSAVGGMASFFAATISLAVFAGTVMWTLDTWNNKHQFPREFLRGSFEGFWWAYVSMTTVGYGDLTPSSGAARLFAVVWILVGITIFNVYTATITSTLTNEMTKQIPFTVQGQKIGVLTNTTAGYIAVNSQYAVPVEYSSVDEMVMGLRNEEVFAVAMVDHMAFYYLHAFQRANEKFMIKLQVGISGSSYGMVSEFNISQKIYSYLHANEDSKEYSISKTLRKLLNATYISNSSKSTKQLFGQDAMFLLTAASILGLTIATGFLGVLINVQVQRRKLANKSLE